MLSWRFCGGVDFLKLINKTLSQIKVLPLRTAGGGELGVGRGGGRGCHARHVVLNVN